MKTISNESSETQRRYRRMAASISGIKITSQRALILEIIRKGQGHLDADEIYRRARVKQPLISLSTVYRTLKALKKPGLIDELHLDDNRHRYEAKPSSKHHHMVCLGCGKVIEFEYPVAQRIASDVPEARDFDIVDMEIRMTGYCHQCQQRRE